MCISPWNTFHRGARQVEISLLGYCYKGQVVTGLRNVEQWWIHWAHCWEIPLRERFFPSTRHHLQKIQTNGSASLFGNQTVNFLHINARYKEVSNKSLKKILFCESLLKEKAGNPRWRSLWPWVEVLNGTRNMLIFIENNLFFHSIVLHKCFDETNIF